MSDGDMADASREEARNSSSDEDCFTGDMRVLTPTGYERIDSLMVGSAVLTFDPDNRALVHSTVKHRLVFPAKSVHEIHFVELPHSLRVTRRHALRLSSGSWKRVGSLVTGMRLQHVDGREIEIASISKSGREEVYNLYPFGHKTFVVEGIVAHSFGYFRTIREHGHRLMEKLQQRDTIPSFALSR